MSDGNKFGRPFESGTAPRSGRVAGSRNKLNAQFLDDLREAWEKHGKEALRITAIEQPAQLAKIVASILPRELEISDSRLKDLSDDDLETLTEILKRSLGSARSVGSREEPPTLN